ncbi:MAG TPA: TonB-dependent receptor, partial [Alphaproteobacteria bacterium]|nr:TonB-dependent receptor [Alphaproteobacteria bacterium]
PEPPRFQLACANLQNCLPVFGYQGDDADFWGYETELHIPLPFSAYSPHLKLFSDYVRGWFPDGALGDVPPLRAGFELTASHGPWQAGLRYTRALAQNRPGLKETSTDGYDRLDLDMSYDWKATNRIKLLLFSKVSNMTQSVIRNSTSFLRNFAPEPGFSF